MIRFDNVSKRYSGGYIGLEHVGFHLKRGEFAFLTGHSGAGKSTLLKLIILLERVSAGQIWVGGHNLRSLGQAKIPYFRRNVGVVFQDHQLLFDRTVLDNVALPLQISGYSPREGVRRVHAALDMVGLLNKEKLYPSALSSGQQQRIGLARAIVNRPSLILADEPTGNLDPQLSTEIMQLFENFNKIGVTVLLASHDLALIAQMRRRILTLDNGRLVSDRGGSK
ncbi:MAG: cell division ATP-binding protein FtsE [Candidatus Endonucleobacter bathymodioli]|uniref:Cell division ATP-binding protein FtsE n=1 Tax=Candidatus Endonucleibacter bathymodioli TaxID=539814 RepID=A0AA90STG2_9GAMM|nr:cell division ATP-binding protein FtsE [Candidatus Endonucleobacter bathymodioli]